MQRRRGGVRDRGTNSTPLPRSIAAKKTRSCLGAGRPVLRRRRLAVVEEVVGVGLDAVEMHRAFLNRAAADVAGVGALLVDLVEARAARGMTLILPQFVRALVITGGLLVITVFRLGVRVRLPHERGAARLCAAGLLS